MEKQECYNLKNKYDMTQILTNSCRLMKELHTVNPPMSTEAMNRNNKGWEPPQDDWLKLNFDDAFL